LSNSGGGSAAVDPLLPGIRVYVIVGFCDIHHFEECLVKLSDGILTFVNTIASIVHESVCAWDGQCNKNLGNAFVILWRIADELSLLNLVKTSSFRKWVGARSRRVRSAETISTWTLWANNRTSSRNRRFCTRS
jgi:hypothetical protein